MAEIRQVLNRQIAIKLIDRCVEPGCEEASLMEIANSHTEIGEGERVYLDIHASNPDISFGLPKDEICQFIEKLGGAVPQKGFIQIRGIDVSGNQKCYCLRLDQSSQWQNFWQLKTM